MRTDDFDYDLPRERIAQTPAIPRDSCRLLVLDRKKHSFESRTFRDILSYLDPGDLLVVNDTRVMAARLVGRKAQTHGVCEVFLTCKREDVDASGATWECLVRPGKRLRQGSVIEFCDTDIFLLAHIGTRAGDRGLRLVSFEALGGLSLEHALHRAGTIPLPPYITSFQGDLGMYQTVYARTLERSAAAPTAGLHFTEELIRACTDRGVGWSQIELEVGIDTFRTVEEDDPTLHQMHTERFHISQDVIDAIHATKSQGGRVIAVGTTTVRCLESAWDADAPYAGCQALYFEEPGAGDIKACADGITSLFLMPGSRFHVCDAIITNFHVPRSTLLMLVSAFAGRDFIMEAYRYALEHEFRFLSFGDAMLIM